MAATNPYRHRHILTNTHRTLVNFAFCVSMHHRVHRTVLRHAVDFARTHATSALATVPVLLRARVGAGEGAGSRGAAAGVRDRRHTCPEVHIVVSSSACGCEKVCARCPDTLWAATLWADTLLADTRWADNMLFTNISIPAAIQQRCFLHIV